MPWRIRALQSIVTSAPAITELDNILRLINAARGCEIRTNFAVENSDPMQRQPQVGRST